MPVFDCDDKGLERSLREMHDIILDSGGVVHDQLVIRGRDGQLNLEAPFATEPNRPILTVPGEALLPVEKFELGLQGDEIGIVSVSGELTDLRKALLDLFVDVYNRTGKIAFHKRVSTLLLKIDDPTLFEKLYEARQRRGNYEKFFQGINLKDHDDLVIKSFLRTRQLGCKSNKDKAAVNMLAPLLDFVNNHPRSPIYNSGFPPQIGYTSSISRSCPKPNSDECYVSYGMNDSHDILLSYNYVESDTYFTRSVPINIELPFSGKRMDILSNQMQPIPKNKLPHSLRDMHAYFPPIHFKADDKNILEVGYLPIPQGKAPLALRRIIGFLVRTVAPDLSQAERKEVVQQAEKTILQRNIDYYTEFSRFLEGYKPRSDQEMIVDMARQMAAIQLENIRKYPLTKLAA